MNSILSLAGSIFSYAQSFIYRETATDISIHGNFVKIPYVYEDKRYYTIVPIHKERKKIELVKKLIDEKPHNDIYVNNILDCVVKLTDEDEERNVMDEIERYMGPDQVYHDYTELILVSDVLPSDWLGFFEYMNITDMNFETRTLSDIKEKLFEQK
jgi:hypothetical protein